ncbi:MAG: IPExxxVDY family protein [Bacteroidales bacterium]|jgi:hypothetical protein|nr:IPExxxVDY family protein [Bacteroidales bacterium]
MAKKNIMKLDIPQDVFMFTLIGISSHENDYRLSWSLNKQLDLKFTQGEDFTVGTGEKFTRFVHVDEKYSLTIISNRCDNGFLLDKYKNFDFLLKFEGELPEQELSDWLHALKKVPLISAVFPIQIDKKILQRLV